MRQPLFYFVGCLIALLAVASGNQAIAVVIHDEASDGDLSGLYTNPTQFNLVPGTNSLLATSAAGDLEYVRVDLPANHLLSELVVSSYESEDQTSFFAVQSGEAFTFPANLATQNMNNMLGFGHFGPESGDLLSAIGGPLQGPTYTFWFQQTGDTTSYQLDFIVRPVPEPATWLLMGMTLVAGTSMRRIWRRSFSANRSG